MENQLEKHYYDAIVDAKSKQELREKVLAAIEALPEHEQSSIRIIGSYKVAKVQPEQTGASAQTVVKPAKKTK